MSLPVKDYPDYLVYETGMIWSNKTHKFLKPANRNGYQSVELFNEYGGRMFSIHRLVAEAFIPNPYNYPQINHKNEIRSDNNVDNLEWCTAKYNMNYGEGAKTRHLKQDYSKPIYKENAIKNGKKASKPVAMFSIKNELISIFESAAEASRQTGIYKTTITRSARSHLKAGGYIWKYAEGRDDLSAYQS
jgi:hypothetical protein